MRAFLVAVQFLTCVPVDLREVTAREVGRSVWFFPWVGALVGGILYGAYHLAGLAWPDPVARLLTLVLLIVVSGAFHLDGLADAVDGLYGGATREEALRLMRDPHVGAMGVLAILSVLLLKGAVFISLPEEVFRRAVWSMPIVGHCAMVAMVAFPYARPEGLGRPFADHRCRGALFLAGLLAAGAAFALHRYAGLLALGGAVAAVVALGVLAWRKLRGVTGDLCGAANEVAETAFLLTLLARVCPAPPGGGGL